MAEPLPQLTIFSRSNCHLCDVMHAQLQKFVADRGINIATVDIDGSPDLAQRYGTRVPVLMVDGKEVCHYRLDLRLLSEVLGPV